MQVYSVLKTTTIVLMCMFVFACANLTHFNEKVDLDNNSAVFIDAKQRGVFTYERKVITEKDVKANDEKYKKEKVTKIMRGFCAEPSPDAVSALATTLGLDLTITDKGKLGFSSGISEGVANIGLRTAAIQALRDVMYRNCEAYAGGGISTFGLETLQRRFQSTMVAILAIEQLTGAVRVPNTVIVSDTSAGSPEAILDLTNKTETARALVDSSKDAEKKAKQKVDSAKGEKNTADEEKNTFDTEIAAIEAKKKTGTALTEGEQDKLNSKDTKTKELEKTQKAKDTVFKEATKSYELAQATTKNRQKAFDAIDASRVAALSGGGTAKNTAVIPQISKAEPLSEEAVETVSYAVLEIVKTTTQLNFITEVCTTLIGQHGNQTVLKNSPLSLCISLASAQNEEDRKKILNKFHNAFDFGGTGWDIEPKNDTGTGPIER